MLGTYLAANQIGWVARDAAASSDTIRLQGLVAILFSCAYVEAAVNELLHQIQESQDETAQRLRPFLVAAGLYERFTPLDRKLKVLGVAATGTAVDFGAQPFQDFDLLLDLRNWLVHLRSETLSVRANPSESGATIINAEYHKLIEQLRARKIITVQDGELLSVADAAQFAGAGAWSFRTAERVLDELQKWIPGWRRPIMGKVEAVS